MKLTSLKLYWKSRQLHISYYCMHKKSKMQTAIHTMQPYSNENDSAYNIQIKLQEEIAEQKYRN